MGYYMNMRDNSFYIEFKNKAPALKALKDFCRKNKSLSWVDSDVVVKSQTLEEALMECRYSVENDAEGNIIDIWFDGEKLGDDDDIFNSFAEYVKEGSYIEMGGEDGSMWRWSFKCGKCEELNPQIIWG